MARQYHWWIATRDETGKPYLIYGAPDYGSDGVHLVRYDLHLRERATGCVVQGGEALVHPIQTSH